MVIVTKIVMVQDAPKAKSWIVIDMRTKLKVAGPFKNKRRAYNKADRLDNEYGAYRYTVKEIT